MKKIIGGIVLLLVIAAFTESQAQSKSKFGHLDFAALYGLMPELDSVRGIFDDYNKTIQQQFASMQTELENKFMDYQANSTGMSEIIRTTKEAEINDLKERLDAFETKATQDLQAKESELTSPIIERAKKAVQEVAKEYGYSYIFNSSEGLLLFAEPSDDISALVKARLGIKETTPEK
ncbi:MAG: OmpH family outer membrane protein [Bacteroidetes bacterium]|nr:OmpH family outer membrane protein [Bacteroidota bacterium]